MKSTILRAYFFIVATVTLTSPAFAYLDPATGSMILQGLIGAIAASIAVISIYYHRFKAFFFRKFPKLDKEGKYKTSSEQ